MDLFEQFAKSSANEMIDHPPKKHLKNQAFQLFFQCFPSKAKIYIMYFLNIKHVFNDSY